MDLALIPCKDTRNNVTPLITWQPRTIPYLKWYNAIPSFVPMDPNMHPMYYSKRDLIHRFLGEKREMQPVLFNQNQCHLLSSWCKTKNLLKFQFLDYNN
jgi:hypothetical protein